MSCFSLNERIAITKCNTKLKELSTENRIDVKGGVLLKITKIVSLSECFVKIYSFHQKTLTLSSEAYSCAFVVLKILNETFASMLVSIPDREKRLMISSSDESEKFLINLKLNDLAKVNKNVLDLNEDAICIIKYIGPVPQIGPGTYIGFVLFDENNNAKDKNNLFRQYFGCNKRNGFLRNAGCFFTRTFLLNQDNDKLVATIKNSQPKLEPKPIDNKQNKATKPRPQSPIKTVTKKAPTPSAPMPIIKNVLYEPNLIPKRNVGQYQQSTSNSAVIIQQQPHFSMNEIGFRSPPPAYSAIASYPKQKYIPENNLMPIEPFVATNLKPQNKYEVSSNIKVTKSSIISPSFEKITTRRSIREGPKSTARRIIITETETHTASGSGKKKKRCVIM